MGLFDFWKSSGKKVAKGDDGGPSHAALRKEVEDLGIAGGSIDLKVDGDKVTVGGEGLSAEDREKVILAVGNVDGVAQVEAEGVEDDGQFVTVEKGDTLWAISERTLGKGSRYKEIFEANRPMLSDPDKIYPGQKLRIPVTRSA